MYFHSLRLDDTGKRVYRDDEECARKVTVFVVLAQGVFVEYQVHEGELTAEAIEPILRELRERWRDTARLQGFLVDTLRDRQQQIASLEHRLGRVRSIIDSARRLKAGETLNGPFGLWHEEDRKLAAGEEPLEVIVWALDEENSRGGYWGDGGTNPDPLEEYRL